MHHWFPPPRPKSVGTYLRGGDEVMHHNIYVLYAGCGCKLLLGNVIFPFFVSSDSAP
jgi:hypothetical protein